MMLPGVLGFVKERLLDFNYYWELLKQLYKPGRHELAGLEINSNFIKLLKLNTKTSPYLIEHAAVLALPEELIVNDQIKDVPTLSRYLLDAYQQSGIKANELAIAIPRSAVITKMIAVNAHMTPDEIESRVWIEADRHFPSLIGEIYLDFSVIGPQADDPDKLEILLVASRKDLVDPYLAAARGADLSIKVVDIDSYALQRALFLTLDQARLLESIAYLNLNHHSMSLGVIYKGDLIYATDQQYQGENTAGTVNSHEENFLSDSDANMENMPLSDVKESSVTSYLRHMMQFFYSSRPNVSIQQLVLSGDCASMEMASTIQKEIGIETVLATPFENMTMASGVYKENLEQHQATMLLCCGLALSEIK